MRENKMKKIRIAAAGDNCMDVYDKENKAFPGGDRCLRQADDGCHSGQRCGCFPDEDT